MKTHYRPNQMQIDMLATSGGPDPCLPLHELAPLHPKYAVLSTGLLWASLCSG
jgi:hypothetical protein